MFKTILAITILTVLACNGIDDEPFYIPDNAVELQQPPEMYKQWWEDISNCAHLNGDFRKITWYVVPGLEFSCAPKSDLVMCFGLWEGGDHHDYIFLASVLMNQPRLVEHEMLHSLLGPLNKGLMAPHDTLFTICHVE